jgi:hypothetical protein
MSQLPAPARPEGPFRFTAGDSSGPALSGSLSSIIRRIEDTIDLETAAIRKDTGFDLAASNARKSRYLYELNRAATGLSPQNLSDEHVEGLKRLRTKLEINEQTILAHLNAVTEVAGMLQEAIQQAEADGTYSASEFNRD